MVSAFDYTNDALGRRTARADSGSAFASTQANAFGYNARSEVASATMRNGTSSYEFDPIGNRTEATLPEEPQPLVYLSNPLNQYTNIVLEGEAPSEPRHDADGNMLMGPAGPDRATLAMVWDAENRLVAVTNGNTLVVSDYDSRSRRTRKRVFAFADNSWSLAESRTFLYDGWNLVRETIANQQSTITNSFVWGLDLSGSFQGAGGIGGLLSLHRSGIDPATYFPSFDGNGNVSEYNDTEGVVAAHYEYDAFGRTITQSGALADAFSHRFSTKFLDPETGLYYYGYRYYSAGMGRWVSRDPIEEWGGSNLGAFVYNSAITLVDISGNQAFMPLGSGNAPPDNITYPIPNPDLPPSPPIPVPPEPLPPPTPGIPIRRRPTVSVPLCCLQDAIGPDTVVKCILGCVRDCLYCGSNWQCWGSCAGTSPHCIECGVDAVAAMLKCVKIGENCTQCHASGTVYVKATRREPIGLPPRGRIQHPSLEHCVYPSDSDGCREEIKIRVKKGGRCRAESLPSYKRVEVRCPQ